MKLSRQKLGRMPRQRANFFVATSTARRAESLLFPALDTGSVLAKWVTSPHCLAAATTVENSLEAAVGHQLSLLRRGPHSQRRRRVISLAVGPRRSKPLATSSRGSRPRAVSSSLHRPSRRRRPRPSSLAAGLHSSSPHPSGVGAVAIAAMLIRGIIWIHHYAVRLPRASAPRRASICTKRGVTSRPRAACMPCADRLRHLHPQICRVLSDEAQGEARAAVAERAAAGGGAGARARAGAPSH